MNKENKKINGTVILLGIYTIVLILSLFCSVVDVKTRKGVGDYSYNYISLFEADYDYTGGAIYGPIFYVIVGISILICIIIIIMLLKKSKFAYNKFFYITLIPTFLSLIAPIGKSSNNGSSHSSVYIKNQTTYSLAGFAFLLLIVAIIVTFWYSLEYRIRIDEIAWEEAKIINSDPKYWSLKKVKKEKSN